jgi:hypothetical protein
MINMKKTFKLTDLTATQMVNFQQVLNPAATFATLQNNFLPNDVRQLFVEAWKDALKDAANTMTAEEKSAFKKKIDLFEAQIANTKDITKNSAWGKVINSAKATGKFVKDSGRFVKENWILLTWGTVVVASIIANAMADNKREVHTVHFVIDRD